MPIAKPIRFNDLYPPAPEGAENVKWQGDDADPANVSAYLAKDIHRVGITIDGGDSPIATGVKGSIQVDFAGTIIGWSIEADQSGSISIEVDKKAGTQTAPAVPNTTTDKISASAPIALSSAQAVGVGVSGVSTWTTSVARWDSIQFNVASASTVKRVTLWIRIQES